MKDQIKAVMINELASSKEPDGVALILQGQEVDFGLNKKSVLLSKAGTVAY